MAAVLFCLPAAAGDSLQARVERRLPVLRRDVSIDADCRTGRGNDAPECLYIARIGSERPVPLRRSSDLKPFLGPVESRAHALALARFFSDPPSSAFGNPRPFDDVPYRELGAEVGAPGEDPILKTAKDVLTAYWIEPPRVANVRIAEGDWRFVVVRYVFFNDEIEGTMRDGFPKRIARVEETIDRDGKYETKIETIPVDKDFRVRAYPRLGPRASRDGSRSIPEAR